MARYLSSNYYVIWVKDPSQTWLLSNVIIRCWAQHLNLAKRITSPHDLSYKVNRPSTVSFLFRIIRLYHTQVRNQFDIYQRLLAYGRCQETYKYEEYREDLKGHSNYVVEHAKTRLGLN